MIRSFLVCALAALPLASVASFVPSRAPQQGGAWDIDFDDPGRSGSVTVTVTVSYPSSTGAKEKKEITATVDVDHAWDAEKKRRNVEGALDSAIDQNKVNGQALLDTTGAADRMIVSASGGSLSAKIEKIEIDDRKTGEDDDIDPPAQGRALAKITLAGHVLDAGKPGGSVFTISTNLGQVALDILPGQSFETLLALARSGLAARGAAVWLDLGEPAVFVLLGEEGGVQSIGAGCTDEGVVTSCAVLAP
jgi:hypothetical protein